MTKYYAFGVTGKDRKALVTAISEILGTEHKYCGPPRYEFTIGDDYTVDRDGTLIGPEDISLIAWLADKGFELEGKAQPEADEAATEAETAPQPVEAAAESETAPEPEDAAAEAEIAPEPDDAAAEAETALEPDETAAQAEIASEPEETASEAEITPEPDETAAETETAPEPVEAAANTEIAPEPYGTAFEAETTPEPVEAAAEAETMPEPVKTSARAEDVPEADDNAPDRLTIEYPLKNITGEALANLRKMVAAKAPLLKKALGAEELPILTTPDSLKFPWFSGPLDGDTVHAYAQFISCLVETAKRKKRVTAQTIDTDNPRFSMRVWSISLGMIGSEYGKIRRLLYQNLDGDSGWRYGSPKKAEKQADLPNPGDALPDSTVLESK